MANYVPRYVTHTMRRVPRQVAQFPSKLKFKSKMSRHKLANNKFVLSKPVVYPEIFELEELRKERPYTEEELWSLKLMAPMRRLHSIAGSVTELVRFERIEGRKIDLEETRQYTELLISLAAQNGDRHRPTMELVDFYLQEKDLIPKLFDLLVPRFQKFRSCYTNLYNLPPYNMRWLRKRNQQQLTLRAILELKGNPWPAVLPKPRDHSGLITNVLLKAAKSSRDLERQRWAREKVVAKIGAVNESLEAPSDSRAATMLTASLAASMAPPLESSLPLSESPYEAYTFDVNEAGADEDAEEDDNDIDVQLRNLDLNLTSWEP